MPQTVRVYWGRMRGRTPLNFNWPDINRTSTVLISACEWHTDGNHDPQDHDYTRFVGDATIRVDNIAPHGPPSDPNNGVTFVVEVDWEDALPICTDVTLLDNVPVQFVHLENASDL
jgi:hypothetical protein